MSSAHRGRAATPAHCPFCGEQDVRPHEEAPTAWVCRACARVFTLGLLRVDHSLVPAHSPAAGAR